jgi:anti-sigma factor RsiW
MDEDEKFFAWLDGELTADEAAEVEAKVAADPQLQRLADQHRAFGARLKGAFDPVAEAPVPERLQAALRSSAEVIDFGAAKRARTPHALPQWAAMAATLAVGIFAGTMIPHRGGGAPVEVQGGQLYAAASLDRALNTQLASAPAGDVRVGMTFRAQAGEICRTFTQRAASGLACRAGGRWKLKGLFGAPEGQGSDYRMAAGMDPNLAALVDLTITGEPFDAAKEHAAKERGWK